MDIGLTHQEDLPDRRRERHGAFEVQQLSTRTVPLGQFENNRAHLEWPLRTLD